MKKIEVQLNVSGSVIQEIELYPEHKMSKKELVAALKRGDIVTSIGHGPAMGLVYLLPEFVQIGRVFSQRVCDDLEISID